MMPSQPYQLLVQIVRDHCGLELGQHSAGSIAIKLGPVLQRTGLGSLQELSAALVRPQNVHLRQLVAEVLAVPESSFFRNKECFAYIAGTLLPRLMERRTFSRRIRIWSAACSTGQEPYSLAMMLADQGAALEGWSIELLATDFSNQALARAREGRYSQFEVQRGVPAMTLIKNFEKVGPLWQIKPEIKSRVRFEQHNLLHSCADFQSFDLILCRNVLIYFSAERRTAVLNRLAGRLAKDGCLILGAAETTTGVSQAFQRDPDFGSGVFFLKGSPADTAEVSGLTLV